MKRFMLREAALYHLQIKTPITVKLAPEVNTLPPETPQDKNILKAIWGSLHLRYWASVSNNFEGPSPDIKIFLVYYDPKIHATLDPSIGLEEGLIGVARVFADPKQAEQNNVVITHEMLPTVGATDKYDLDTLQPAYPDGSAKPNKIPVLPQKKAEIMGERIPVSKLKSNFPRSLGDVIVGEQTEKEIRWLE